MVVLLVALVIVAFLAQSALKQYGLLSTSAPAVNTGVRGGPAVAPAPPDASETAPAPTAPIERARSLEREVQRDAQDLSRRIDEQTK